MRPEGVLQMLRSHPFEPFRIHMSDGSFYDITHPELAIVKKSKVFVGIAGPKGPDAPVQNSVYGAMIHISRLEKLNGHQVG